LRARNNQAAGFSIHIDIKVAALLVQFLASIAFNLMGSFLPLFISSELNHTLIDATYWTGIAQLIASSLMAFTAPFWGFMCDRVGTKKIMMVVLVGNTVVYGGMAMSTSVLHIIAFRGLQGAFGGLSTVMFSLVARIEKISDLKKALSYQMVAMTLGGLVGPGIGGLLANIVGYRMTFAASSFLFISIIPMAFVLSMPPPAYRESEPSRFEGLDLKAMFPDVVALILVYACISFIGPTIPWFMESLGVPYEQLLTFTALVTILNGLAFAIATPLLTRVVTYRTLPILSVATAGAIFLTTFVTDAYQFIALRVIIGSIQAGIPPSLLGGKGTRGAAMGFLNSARFMGMAIGPFLATSILGNGETLSVLYMFTAMTGMSLLSSLVIYLTHTRQSQD
jgi:DHA1 family multidrug resistance protein-like MFS transporter